MNDQEMIAAPLNDILEPFFNKMAEKFCECIQNYAQQPGVQPCQAFPFFINGSVSQTFVCHKASNLIQIPKGQTATITRLAFAERYPGTLYGANFMLLVNDNFSPELPRIDSPVGGGLGMAQGTKICLQDQDILSVMIQCSWTPTTFTGIESTYVQTLFPFQISGFYEYKAVA